MDDKPKVSIIIPVYNVEQYLRQCLDSVCNQTFKDIEIIVVNDCSPDNSLYIIKKYQDKDERIVLVDLKQNVGVGFARNAGMRVAKGEYITFVDPDDWVKENFIEVLYNSIKKYNTDFVSVNYIKVCGDKFFNHKVKSSLFDVVICDDKIKRQLLLNIPVIQIWTKIFKKSFLFSNNIYFRINKFEDNVFTWETIIKSKSFIFISDIFYYHRINRVNSIMTNLKTSKTKYCYKLQFCKDIKDMLLNIQSYQNYKKEFLYYVTTRAIQSLEEYGEKSVFANFRLTFYDNDYVLCYGYAERLALKLKLYIFKICLNFNINYIFFCNIFSFIKKRNQ